MSSFWGPFTQQPNILILMTDQQRTAQHMPAGWVEQNLPNLWWLMQHGVTFPNAMTNASPCSTSRAVLWTSTYPAINGVTQNADDPDTSLSHLIGTNVLTKPNEPKPGLPLGALGLMLTRQGVSPVAYDVEYKGKWHLQFDYQQGIAAAEQNVAPNPTREGNDDSDMAGTFGFSGWTSPDFGTSVSIGGDGVNTLGGGHGGNDERVVAGTSYAGSGTVASACAYLANLFADGAPTQPFCLIASLVNPHDVWVSTLQEYFAAGYLADAGGLPWQQAPFTDITELPATYSNSPAILGNKPDAQKQWRTSPALAPAAALDYFRFYAYLETLSDALLGQVLAALPQDQYANTLIVRVADHGEMGMSQGGMREKEAQAYNETLLVPMIFSHPGLPQGASCTGLAGLIDIVPTIAEICGLQNLSSNFAIQGRSIAPAILQGGTGVTYSRHLFQNTWFESHALVDDQRKCKYVVTQMPQSTAWQYELYDFSYDPACANPWDCEASNLIPVNGLGTAGPAVSPELQTRWHNMHLALHCAMADNCVVPINWPKPPPLPN